MGTQALLVPSTQGPHPEPPETRTHGGALTSPLMHTMREGQRDCGVGVPDLLFTQDLLCDKNITHDVGTPVSLAEGIVLKEDYRSPNHKGAKGQGGSEEKSKQAA